LSYITPRRELGEIGPLVGRNRFSEAGDRLLQTGSISPLIGNQSAQKYGVRRDAGVCAGSRLDGQPVALLAFADAVIGRGFRQIERREGWRSAPGQFDARHVGRSQRLTWLVGDQLGDRQVIAVVADGAGVVSRKGADEEKRWVYLDVGKFNGLAETMDESIKYRIATPGRGGAAGLVVLAGPTCDSADILYERTEYRLPLGLAIGDKVEILATGAYTASYASVGFNGFSPIRTYCI